MVRSITAMYPCIHGLSGIYHSQEGRRSIRPSGNRPTNVRLFLITLAASWAVSSVRKMPTSLSVPYWSLISSLTIQTNASLIIVINFVRVLNVSLGFLATFLPLVPGKCSTGVGVLSGMGVIV
jgi:hypothetical protein